MFDDLMDPGRFRWRLRVLMEIADLRCGELADMTGLSINLIYLMRHNREPSKRQMGIIFGAIESARPGALDMLRAAEKASTPPLREHDVRKVTA